MSFVRGAIWNVKILQADRRASRWPSARQGAAEGGRRGA